MFNQSHNNFYILFPIVLQLCEQKVDIKWDELVFPELMPQMPTMPSSQGSPKPVGSSQVPPSGAPAAVNGQMPMNGQQPASGQPQAVPTAVDGQAPVTANGQPQPVMNLQARGAQQQPQQPQQQQQMQEQTSKPSDKVGN